MSGFSRIKGASRSRRLAEEGPYRQTELGFAASARVAAKGPPKRALHLGRTGIIDDAVKDAMNTVVDPIPSALVLTAIVIGVAITALMLSYAVQLYKSKGSLSIEDYEELKW